MTDRELLELAAKAAGLEINERNQKARDEMIGRENSSLWLVDGSTAWNPLTNDGNALRLAVKLGMDIDCTVNSMMKNHTWAMSGLSAGGGVAEYHEGDPYAATRRAIVRVAAEIGKAMP